jgi:hypothetical protein
VRQIDAQSESSILDCSSIRSNEFQHRTFA